MQATLQAEVPAVLALSMEGQSAALALQNDVAEDNHKCSARCGQEPRSIHICTPPHVACGY
eukprot:2715276-Pyramimonas_sp.AAC.1